MNRHWSNLLITNEPSRRKGLTCASAAHGTTRRNEDRRALEMGAAFCDRGHVALSGGNFTLASMSF